MNEDKEMKTTVNSVFVCVTLALLVASAKSQTVWNSATDGLWSNSAAWTAGVPDFNNVFITNTVGSYTVSMATGVDGSFSDLTLANAGANTTRLEIADSTLSGSNGVVTVNDGSELVLRPSGTFLYETAVSRVSDFATVPGLLRIEGGLFQVGPTNLQDRLDTRYLTIPAGGLFEMTNGVANFYGGRLGGVYVNGGTLHMSGGTMMLVNTNESGGGESFKLHNAGYVRLDGTAHLVTSNAFYLNSYANTTTRLEIDGEDASFTFASLRRSGRPSLYAYGYTAIDVRQGRLSVGIPTDYTEVNFIPQSSGGTVAVNVWEGGYVAFKQIVMARDRSAGMAQVNIYGGIFDMPGSGNISVGRDSYKAGVIAQVNVTNGVFDMSDTSKIWRNRGAPALAVGWNYGGGTRTPWGEVNLSGGAISNAGACVLGQNKAMRGDLNQSGGIFRQGFGNANLADSSATGHFVAGFSGGSGTCIISNGLFEAVRDVYVGGADALARWGMTEIYASWRYGNTNVAPGSVGTFSVVDGSVIISNTVAEKTATLHVGDYGTGTVSIAESASIYAQTVELHASSDGVQDSTVNFTLGQQGAGTFVCDTLKVDDGAKLVVDASAYAGDSGWIKLIECATRDGSFDTEDISVIGIGEVRQDKDASVWFCQMNGTLILLM